MRRLVRSASFALAAMIAASCGASPSSPPPRPATTSDDGTTSGSASIHLTVDGYPLDRSLQGLASYPNLDAVLLVSQVQAGRAHWTTKDGLAPAYIKERRSATEAESASFNTIVTPINATITKVLRGSLHAGDSITFEVVGGVADGVEVGATDEVAPDLVALMRSGTILVAGPVVNGKLTPTFVYDLPTPNGTVRSLLASASDGQPAFTIAALDAALAAPDPIGPNPTPTPSASTSG